ncbi:unnamed protein product [Orchesella dallaii]|uniref:EDR1/CTR1/ARMC3-like peptidase-like domain-containing protein n=1 Tax=Orchesella dallaii TaxID=48710 RepID=A0ABP1S5X0_9HEXA
MQEQQQDLQDVIETIRNQRASITSEPSLVRVIAKVVSNRFGGPLDKWRFTASSEDVEIENIQNLYKSIIIPISFLATGAFRTRAVVFKALCDMFGLPCSLETGDYKKAWNVVLLRPDAKFVSCN